MGIPHLFYRLDADYKIEKLENNINTSKIVFAGVLMVLSSIFADTWQGEIWSYDYDLENRPNLK